MSKRIALIGHCGPDMTYLMLAVNKAVEDASIERINDEAGLQKFLKGQDGLMLVNRALDGDFVDEGGVELIARAYAANPLIKSMLISNFEAAQQSAIGAGALRGFGKRDIGSAKVTDLIRAAVGEAAG